MDLNATVTEPSGRAQPTELVFVHGAWHGAWRWIEHFTEFFADLPRPARVVDPVMVLGAQHDAIFSSPSNQHRHDAGTRPQGPSLPSHASPSTIRFHHVHHSLSTERPDRRCVLIGSCQQRRRINNDLREAHPIGAILDAAETGPEESKLRRWTHGTGQRSQGSTAHLTTLVNDPTVKLLSQVHTLLYRATNGIIGQRLVKNDMLLLTTTGRKSGDPHTVPLLYLQDQERLIVIASYGGRPKHPSWYGNLIAHPEAWVQILGDRRTVNSRTMDDEERAKWWPKVVAAYGDYAVYQSKTDREIPLIWLE